MRSRWTVLVGFLAFVFTACSGGGDPSTETSARSGERPTTVAARASAGCGAAPVAPGEERITTTSGDAERWYYRHVPPAHDGEAPVPVVLDLHGYSEGAQVHLMMSNLGAFGDEKGFVTITPQGTAEPVPRWDIDFASKDYAYIVDLLDEVNETLCVDENRVYVTGLSNGAFFTSSLVCKLADRIAAVAPVAGVRAVDDCNPSRPVPVSAFHGTDDDFVRYDGGFGGGAARLPAPDGSNRTMAETPAVSRPPESGPSVPETTTAWAKRNGCDTKPIEKQVSADTTLMTFSCPKGATVQLYTTEGGGHTWPGSEFSKAVASVVGKTTDTISANELMWEFFQAHPRREA